MHMVTLALPLFPRSYDAFQRFDALQSPQAISSSAAFHLATHHSRVDFNPFPHRQALTESPLVGIESYGG